MNMVLLGFALGHGGLASYQLYFFTIQTCMVFIVVGLVFVIVSFLYMYTQLHKKNMLNCTYPHVFFLSLECFTSIRNWEFFFIRHGSQDTW